MKSKSAKGDHNSKKIKWAISKKMKSKRDIRSQKLFLTDACILYLFDKWNHSCS